MLWPHLDVVDIYYVLDYFVIIFLRTSVCTDVLVLRLLFIYFQFWDGMQNSIPASIWRRYVDDIFVVQQQSHKEQFCQHINTVDTSIWFTVEKARPDGSIPFLDILITPQSDGTFTTKVYRKPTHTDLYLHWDSHHDLASKYSLINNLPHRARTICSTPQLLNS